MRHSALACLLLAFAALSMAACSTLQLTSGKTLLAAQDGVTAAANAADAAYQAGAIPKSVIVSIRPFVDDADTWSMTARCAWASADYATVGTVLTDLGLLAVAIADTQKGIAPPPITAPPIVQCANPAPAASVVMLATVSPVALK